MKKLAALVVLAAGLAQGQVDAIRGDRIRAQVRFLASDLLEGRGVGQRGGALATAYIAAQFEAAGLRPGSEDGTYFQKVPLKLVSMEGSPTLEVIHGGRRLTFQWLEDFVGTSFRQEPEGPIDAEVVFAGHGIQAPEFQWDDYAGTDVKGKAVVLFTNEPPSEDPKWFGGKGLTYYGRWTYKYEEATRRGAAAVLIVHTAPTATYGYQVVKANGRPQPQVGREPGAPALGFAGWVTESTGEKIFALTGHSVAEMLQRANTNGFRAMSLGVRVRLKVKSRVEDLDTYNVVGRVDGADPALRDEAVVFTAHWDHLGIGEPVNGDRIYNGAVDNGSGASMLIEMARAWASMEPKPRRSAYFVAVTAEESGLLGSNYFAEHPPLPASKIAANLNFDSYSPFGRMKGTSLTGAERTSFYPVVEEVARRFGLTIHPDAHPETGGYFRSDHFSFVKAGVPAFSVSMAGDREATPGPKIQALMEKLKGSYHQPSDEYSDDWDLSGLEQFARFGFSLGLEVANLERIPARVRP
jgi:Zn-dependent M28 family amino/carboxypeptidase